MLQRIKNFIQLRIYFNYIWLATFIHHFYLLHNSVFDNRIIMGSYKSRTFQIKEYPIYTHVGQYAYFIIQ